MVKDVKAAVPGTKPPKASKLKIPKTPGACTDLLYTKIQEVRELSKPLEVVEADVKALKAHLIDTLPADDAEGVVGALAKVVVNRSEIAQPKDWDQIRAYMVAEGLRTYQKEAAGKLLARTSAELELVAARLASFMPWDFMSRSLSSTAVLARKADGINIPGVESFFVKKVSCTKR